MSLSPPYPVLGACKAFEARIQTASWARTTDSGDRIYMDLIFVKSRVEEPSLGLSGESESGYLDWHSPVIVAQITSYP